MRSKCIFSANGDGEYTHSSRAIVSLGSHPKCVKADDQMIEGDQVSPDSRRMKGLHSKQSAI